MFLPRAARAWLSHFLSGLTAGGGRARGDRENEVAEKHRPRLRVRAEPYECSRHNYHHGAVNTGAPQSPALGDTHSLTQGRKAGPDKVILLSAAHHAESPRA